MLVIDRFEGKYAVCEEDGGIRRNIRRALLPKEAGEGDVLTEKDGRFSVNRAETARRLAHVLRLQKDVFGDGQP